MPTCIHDAASLAAFFASTFGSGSVAGWVASGMVLVLFAGLFVTFRRKAE
ncbi:hypothetical protein BCE02nite_11320 [Brevibacillus centrosporus]|nr:hypothetical protein BCE02nite_11320 [Brevibacillus centrosporus]